MFLNTLQYLKLQKNNSKKIKKKLTVFTNILKESINLRRLFFIIEGEKTSDNNFVIWKILNRSSSSIIKE